MTICDSIYRENSMSLILSWMTYNIDYPKGVDNYNVQELEVLNFRLAYGMEDQQFLHLIAAKEFHCLR